MFLWNNLYHKRISRENLQLQNFSTTWNEILGSIYIITLNNVRVWRLSKVKVQLTSIKLQLTEVKIKIYDVEKNIFRNPD